MTATAASADRETRRNGSRARMFDRWNLDHRGAEAAERIGEHHARVGQARPG